MANQESDYQRANATPQLSGAFGLQHVLRESWLGAAAEVNATLSPVPGSDDVDDACAHVRALPAAGSDGPLFFAVVSSSPTRPSVCCRTRTKFENFRRLVFGCIDADF